MKICVFSHTFPRFKNDIPAAFMDGFCEGLVKVGNEVVVLIPYDQKIKRFPGDQSYNVRTFRYIFPDSLHLLGYSRTLQGDQRLRTLVFLLAPFYYFFGFWALLRLVRKEKIDIINAHWIIPGGFIASLASILLDIPLVITVAGSDVYLATKNRLFKYLALFAAKRAKYVVAGGSVLWAQDLIEMGVDPEKTKHTIIYGVDPRMYYPTLVGVSALRRKYKLSKDDLVILAVGRFVYKKGMHILINAVPRVLERHKNVKFVIIGDGDQRKELEKLVAELHVGDSVIMPGFIQREELRSYYNLCDIYVSSSIRDKKGNVDDQSVALVEAMACRKPAIASDLPGNKLVVNDGYNGFLFPMGNSRKLSEKISKLVKDKKLREKFSQRSLKLARSEYSIEATGRFYTNLFSEILKS